MAGSRHRISHDRRLPSLKVIDGTDADAGNTFLQLEHLRVVGRNDQDFLQPDRRLDAIAVQPRRPTAPRSREAVRYVIEG